MKFFKWTLVLVIFLAAAFTVYIGVKLHEPATTYSSPRDFAIEKGERAGTISSRLASEGFVGSELILKFYLRYKGAEDKLQAGIYILDSNMTIPEIVQIISQGQVKASGIRLTVVEGWNIQDIAARLENLGLMQTEQFTAAAGLPRSQNDHLPDFSGEFPFLKTKPAGQSLEGFLFPDTYLINEDADGAVVVKKMLDNFARRVDAQMYADVEKQERNFYDVLTLASIVEREVGRNFKPGTKLSEQQLGTLQSERRIVAGVFLNRLKLGMALESDATVNYITGKNNPRPLLDDLKVDSPYNTYKYRGLPPTPISNPSLDSIRAAIYPTDTDYIFFLMAPDGTAHFAKTLEEHIQNRAKYLQ